MGQVYRATDTKLKRQVAIKIVPPSLAADADRLARFQREAEVLASLNHPNIAGIYGLEESGGLTALVMELVEGEDLSQRINRGAIPLDEALPIAKQIAEALEAAHEQGIIHRDLKPANIKVRADGTVKVLDFGLAKAIEQAGTAGQAGGAGRDVSRSPTITSPAMTQAGMLLGTAAYMSPEQARGKSVDKRADIWGFGAVLFEIVTGKRAFPGEDITDTIVWVVSKEPDWSALPVPTPVGLRRLLGRCLKKDAKARMRDIGEARLQIEDLLSGGPEEMAPAASGIASPPMAAKRRPIIAIASVTLLVGAAVLATWALTPPAPGKLQPMRFAIVPTAAHPLQIQAGANLALSPDGTHLVYVSRDGQLMVRAIEQLDAVPLGGITDARSPFFSPDGRWVGFSTGGVRGNGGELKKVSITGGPPLSLCRYQGVPRGASWGPDDTIVFATNDTNSGLLRVSAAGGEPTVLTTPDAAHGEADHWFPSVLPGGRAVLFTIKAPGANDAGQVAVLDLTTGQRTILIRGGSQAEYFDLSTRSKPGGYLVYALAGALRAVRFDPETRTVGNDPVPIVEQVFNQEANVKVFSVSRQGALVYVGGGTTAPAARSLVWVTRHGQEAQITAPLRAYQSLRLSPDGTRVALGISDQETDIWIWDLARQTLTRLTDTPAYDSDPVWTPDSRRIIFASSLAGNSNLFWQAADKTGTVERLTTSPNTQQPTAIAPDGTRLIVAEIVPTTSGDLRVLRMENKTGGPRQTEPLLQTTFNELNGEISPDGHWLAYQSNDSGLFQISVRPFPNVDSGHWTISPSGGTMPVWARSGTELFYLDGTNTLTAVPVRTTPTFSAGTPTKLFGVRDVPGGAGRTYDVSPDGQRFLVIKDGASGDQTSTPSSIVVVVNWSEELKQRVPVK